MIHQGTMESLRERLRELLKTKSFKYSPDKPFKLASGRESPFYVDCRPVTHSAEGLALVGEIIFDLIKDLEVAAVGGLTMGADPLAHATALVSFARGRPVNAFSVRKFSKEHGIQGRVVGPVKPGDQVVVLEDVITTGGSVLQAVAAAREFGLTVLKVIVLVDREEGGREAIQEQVARVESIFTLKDLMAD